ncbi:E3 ubiquitin-protein ligase [Striga asiatica]|uniref:E3 ubiquitin-protein ligase n=1 Tax=Striga asiatica TaxID=4170 RepID=A0A5A7P5V0_STRAF|nr:E3 ubiquitin-protein ligase [Striga asiatica]
MGAKDSWFLRFFEVSKGNRFSICGLVVVEDGMDRQGTSRIAGERSGAQLNSTGSIERVLDSIRDSCPNSSHGCTGSMTDNNNKLHHERICPHSPSSCPHPYCSYTGLSSLVYLHFAATHPILNKVPRGKPPQPLAINTSGNSIMSKSSHQPAFLADLHSFQLGSTLVPPSMPNFGRLRSPGSNAAGVLLKSKVADPLAATVLKMSSRMVVTNDIGGQFAYLLSILPEKEINWWRGDQAFRASYVLSHTLQALSGLGPLLDEELLGKGIAAENKRLKSNSLLESKLLTKKGPS